MTELVEEEVRAGESRARHACGGEGCNKAKLFMAKRNKY
jgi:hypothetical protein